MQFAQVRLVTSKQCMFYECNAGLEHIVQREIMVALTRGGGGGRKQC